MEYTISEQPANSDVQEIRVKLQAYNEPFWEVGEREKFTATLRDGERLVSGIVFAIFGEWLEVDYFWVDDAERSKGLGKRILNETEAFARSRGCGKSWLNTFSFQARPFYEKQGYCVVYTQENYPATNTRYFLEKTLE